jgi:hypothetical protein
MADGVVVVAAAAAVVPVADEQASQDWGAVLGPSLEVVAGQEDMPEAVVQRAALFVVDRTVREAVQLGSLRHTRSVHHSWHDACPAHAERALVDTSTPVIHRTLVHDWPFGTHFVPPGRERSEQIGKQVVGGHPQETFRTCHFRREELAEVWVLSSLDGASSKELHPC